MGMIDNELVFCSAMAYNGTPEVIDLGLTFKPGVGRDIIGRLKTTGATGMTDLVILTGTTSSPATTIATLACTHTQANAGFNFRLPVDLLSRYVTVSFTSLGAGTVTYCGLGLDQQSA